MTTAVSFDAEIIANISLPYLAIVTNLALQFTALSGRRSVLERPLSGENGRTFLVNTPDIIGY